MGYYDKRNETKISEIFRINRRQSITKTKKHKTIIADYDFQYQLSRICNCNNNLDFSKKDPIYFQKL